MADITAEKTYSVKKIVQDPQIPDIFSVPRFQIFLGFNSQIPDFWGLYSIFSFFIGLVLKLSWHA